MSRIGKLPVELPDKVQASLKGGELTVKGPRGELTRKIHEKVSLDISAEEIVVKRQSDSKEDKSLQGMTRSIIDSMVEGVTKGFSKKLEMNGVGYSASLQGKSLQLEGGYSHPVVIEPPGNIEFEVGKKNTITVSGNDKQLVGDVAARIRSVREPEPYKGKGIKYAEERIRRKEGKTG